MFKAQFGPLATKWLDFAMIDLACTGVHVPKDGTDMCAIVHKLVFLEQRAEIVSNYVIGILYIISVKPKLQISVAITLFGPRNLCAKGYFKRCILAMVKYYID